MTALRAQSRLRTPPKTHPRVLIPGALLLALMLVWAVHDGGYDEDTWYWGALCVLSLVGALVLAGYRLPASRSLRLALGALAAYVVWSYLSIAWAQAPGTALTGANKALLYLLLFTAATLLPWSDATALLALLAFSIAVGVIAAVLLLDLATGQHVAGLFSGGRLLAPVGYFNGAAALFTMTALVGVALLPVERLPAPLRGLLLAIACGCLQVAVMAQSRGWLFTLPLILIVGALLVCGRLRLVPYAVVLVALVLVNLRRLLNAYDAASAHALQLAAQRAGKLGLLACGGALLVGTLIALAEQRLGRRELGMRGRRALGTAMVVLALAVAVAGGLVATHGHPLRYVSRQWHGFTHTSPAGSTGSHFAQVGSGRYDFWRVSLKAFADHPVGGLGQDNFGDYYLLHRRTAQEPSWTHSLELRLLASTGLVGFLLFAVFLVAAAKAGLGGRRRGRGLERAVTGAALLPLTVWVIHGSVDWFWELPALTAPALGFLGVAAVLGARAGAGQGHEGVAEVDEDAPAAETAPAAEDAPAARDAPAAEGAPVRTGGIVFARAPKMPSRPGQRGLSGSGAGGSAPAAPLRAVRVVGAVVAFLAAAVVLGLPYLSVREVSIANNIGLRNPTSALSRLSRAASLNPLDPTPERDAGWIALQVGNYRLAESKFAASVSREPQGWFSWLGGGLAASALGDRSAARRDFEVAASINSHQLAIKQALARVDTSDPLSVDQALSDFVLVQ